MWGPHKDDRLRHVHARDRRRRGQLVIRTVHGHVLQRLHTIECDDHEGDRNGVGSSTVTISGNGGRIGESKPRQLLRYWHTGSCWICIGDPETHDDTFGGVY